MAKGRVVKINGDARIVDPDGGEAIIPHAPDIGNDILGFNAGYIADIGKVFGGEVSMNYGAGKESDRLSYSNPTPCRDSSRFRCPCESDIGGRGTGGRMSVPLPMQSSHIETRREKHEIC